MYHCQWRHVGPRSYRIGPAVFPGMRSDEASKPSFNSVCVYFVLWYFCVTDECFIVLGLVSPVLAKR